MAGSFCTSELAVDSEKPSDTNHQWLRTKVMSSITFPGFCVKSSLPQGLSAALAHGNRGRRPHNAVPEAAAAAVVKLASNGYAGANHTHLTELLRERESIDLSRPTVRRILTKAGIGSVLAAAAPSNTGSGAGACPRRACWCRSTAATIPGWRTGDRN